MSSSWDKTVITISGVTKGMHAQALLGYWTKINLVNEFISKLTAPDF
jgi:hypothetical protein